tara:strand:- start:690 stop:851 length:162 start_codon:yes stop_codon:yes gene_type:complete
LKITKLPIMSIFTIAVVAGASSSAFEHYYRKMAIDGQLNMPFFNNLFGMKEDN